MLFCENGIASFISRDKVIVDMSTVSPEFIQEISEQEIQFLEATLINEDKIESDLIQMMLIGGDGDAYNKVLPVFQRIIKNAKHLGSNGSSQLYRKAFAVRAKIA